MFILTKKKTTIILLLMDPRCLSPMDLLIIGPLIFTARWISPRWEYKQKLELCFRKSVKCVQIFIFNKNKMLIFKTFIYLFLHFNSQFQYINEIILKSRWTNIYYHWTSTIIELEWLQTVSKPNIRQCASKSIEPLKGVNCEIPRQLEKGTKHLLQCVEISSLHTRFKIIRLTTIHKGSKQTIVLKL